MRYIIVITSIIFPTTLMAAIPLGDMFNLNGDGRIGYYNKHVTKNDGVKSNNNQWRLRLRVGVGADFTENWKAKLRFAGRYFSDQSSSEFVWDGSIPKTDGLAAGQSTFDEAYVKYQAKKWALKVGRMQTKFELKGVARKSLDRNDSPNTDISWTDGGMFSYTSDSSWKTHVILQRNLSSGATNVRRDPLDFSDRGSRITTMVAVENNSTWKAIVQRGFNVSYLPDSLMKDGNTSGRIKDYWGLTAKSAAAWKIGQNKMRFMLAGELGYAPNTQTNTALGIDDGGDANGGAMQLTANFIDFFPKHSFGLVYGYVGGGWLLSPDFRNNNTLVEGRYKWQITKQFKIEARLRQREDLEQLTGTQQKRKDVDYYIRATYKL